MRRSHSMTLTSSMVSMSSTTKTRNVSRKLGMMATSHPKTSPRPPRRVMVRRRRMTMRKSPRSGAARRRKRTLARACSSLSTRRPAGQNAKVRLVCLYARWFRSHSCLYVTWIVCNGMWSGCLHSRTQWLTECLFSESIGKDFFRLGNEVDFRGNKSL